MRIVRKAAGIIFDRVRYRASFWLPFFGVPSTRTLLRQVSFKGATLVVLANEDVGRYVSVLGRFESDDLDTLASFMSDGDICFDIGANIGVVSVFMARAASRVSVYAFEPIRLNQCIIRLNAELNQVDIQVAGVAVADVCGTANFSESVDSAYSSLRPTGRREERRSLPVTVTTLDSYLMANSVPRIDVMKIDVEGAEELVLRGGQNVLADRTRSPRVIMIELVDANLKAFGADVGRVVRLLAKYGYRGFVRDADRRELRPFGPADHNRFYNVFFLKDESKRHHGES